MISNEKRNFRLPRVWSNQILQSVAPIFSGDVVNVSGWDDRDKEGNHYRSYFSNANNYFLSNYVGERGAADASQMTDFLIDLSLPVSAEFIERFDVVYNHTTLEHIFEIDIAFRNLCTMSRDIVIVVVPFAQEVHFNPSYGDYWRFTPMGLRKLYEKNGLEVIFEAANHHINAGIYLLFVGSKYPDKWSSKIPKWKPISDLGNWIGRSDKKVPLLNALKKILNRSPETIAELG